MGLPRCSTILAQFAEAIVLVVDYGELNRSQIARALETLHQAGRTITGVALNRADPHSLGDYGYGYGYGYAYGEHAEKDTDSAAPKSS